MNEETFAAIAKKLHELAEHQTPTSDHVAEVLREQLGDSLGNDFMLDNSDLNSVLKDLRKKLENQTGEG